MLFRSDRLSDLVKSLTLVLLVTLSFNSFAAASVGISCAKELKLKVTNSTRVRDLTRSDNLSFIMTRLGNRFFTEWHKSTPRMHYFKFILCSVQYLFHVLHILLWKLSWSMLAIVDNFAKLSNIEVAFGWSVSL